MRLTINHKVGVSAHLMCGKIFNGHIYKNLLLSLPVKKLFKSVNVWQNCKQEGGLHVDDHEQKQFPMMLMTHIGFAFPELFFFHFQESGCANVISGIPGHDVRYDDRH